MDEQLIDTRRFALAQAAQVAMSRSHSLAPKLEEIVEAAKAFEAFLTRQSEEA